MRRICFLIVLLFTYSIFAQNMYKSPRFKQIEMFIKNAQKQKISVTASQIRNKFRDYEIRVSPYSLKKGAGIEGELSVIVEYESPAVLSEMENIGCVLHTITSSYVTAKLPLQNLQQFLQIKGIRRVDIGYKTRPYNSLAVSAAYPGVAQKSGYTGKNVICGIVDTGIDYTHPMFLKPDGTTRILYLWDQTDDTTGTPPSGFSYGREYTSVDINNDLNAGGNHTYVNQRDLNGHGTHVAGTFAGYDSALVATSDTSFEGGAVEANIIFVKTTFYPSAVNDGVNYIFQKAQALGKPAVVNLSLGSQMGPHDGTDAYTDQLDQMVGPGKIIVRSAGNEGSDAIHTRGTISGVSSYSDINYSVPTTSSTGYLYFDIWYDGGDQMRVEIFENGSNTPNASANYGQLVNTTYYYIDNASSGTDPGNGLNNAFIAILWPLDNSLIRLTLTSDDGDGQSSYHCWISMSSNVSASLNSPSDGYSRGTAYSSNFYKYTLGNGACGDSVIAVGAYMSRKSWPTTAGVYHYTSGDSGGIMYFSSQGPTRDGRNKPECAAGGGMVLSALSGDITPPTGALGYAPDYPQYRWMQGTSMSSPVMAGWVALMLDRYPDWSYSNVLNYIRTHAQGTQGNANTSPKTDPGVWDPAFGYGVADLTYIANYHRAKLAIPATGNYTFTSGSMTLANISFNSESMDSLLVEMYLDSLPPNMPVGAKALPRFYRITPVNSTASFNADVNLYYTDEEFAQSGIVAQENTLDLYRWTGTIWEKQSATVDVTNNVLTKPNATEFSIWAISSTEDASLPVELSEYNGTILENGIELEWITQSETNNLGFEIVRSQDDEEYKLVASYETDDRLKGKMQSNVANRYLWQDYNVQIGHIYNYKILAVSVFGEKEEFGPVKVDYSKNGLVGNSSFIPRNFYLKNAYPNPFNPIVYIPFGVPNIQKELRNVSIEIFDIQGRKVKKLFEQVVLPGTYEISWDGTDNSHRKVSSGIYLVRMRSAGYEKTIKIMLLK